MILNDKSLANCCHQFIRTSHSVEAWTLEQRENVCPRARVPWLPLLLDLMTHTHIYWQWMSSCVALRNCTPQHLLPEGLSAGFTAILRGEWSVTVPCAFFQIHQSLVISISMRELWIIEQPRRGSWFNFNDVKNAVNKQQCSLRCLSRIAFSHISLSPELLEEKKRDTEGIPMETESRCRASRCHAMRDERWPQSWLKNCRRCFTWVLCIGKSSWWLSRVISLFLNLTG